MGCRSSKSKVHPLEPPATEGQQGVAEVAVKSTSGACTLRIFHVNDVYKFDNLPALKTCIDDMSKDATHTLKVMAGDFLAPSVQSTLDDSKGMVELMNAIGFDVVCFGNHECDVKDEELPKRIQELNAVWLNSNMTSFTEEFTREGKLTKGKCPASHVVALDGGRSIALIGLNCGGNASAPAHARRPPRKTIDHEQGASLVKYPRPLR